MRACTQSVFRAARMGALRSCVLAFAAFTATGCYQSHMVDGSERDASIDAFRLDAPGPRDAAPGDALDAAVRIDVGPPIPRPLCDADDAERLPCSDIICDEPDRWQWNGHECFRVPCGTCVGEDCDTGPFERAECEAAHGGCASSQCRATGGTWRFWGVYDCGFSCGFPSGDACIDGPTCDCGIGRTFTPGVGCEDVACVMPRIDPDDPGRRCRETGGEWGGFCAHSHCGVHSGLLCAAPACHCEWPKVYDAIRGCVDGEACYRGDGGCNELSICPEGLECVEGACVARCGGVIDG